MSSLNAAVVLCPNCRQPMQSQQLERHDHGKVRIELCFYCSGLWFDHLASMQLAPGAVIELFKEINAHRKDALRPLANRLTCPYCRSGLVLTYDLSKTGRFSYYRCPRNEGRYTPFFQFLREKQFVRNLTELEIQHIRTQVHQIRCSECGAPVDLEHDSQCKFCHAPISFLDPEAVDKALRLWSEAENRRHSGAASMALVDALQRLPPETRLGDGILLGGASSYAVGGGLDLIALGMQAIGRAFEQED